MITHHITLSRVKKVSGLPRCSVGGSAILADTQQYPTCKLCKARMVLFFQLDLAKEFDLPFQPGSHLTVFMCPTHNEIHSLCPESGKNYQLLPKHPFRKLPERYWTRNPGHFRLLLNPPGVTEQTHDRRIHLIPHAIKFKRATETVEDHGIGHILGSQGFKVGGLPAWSQDPEYYVCSCGARMRFVCQVPGMFGFEQLSIAPEQPNSFSRTQYCLFLGNDVYLFACEDQCCPEAVWPVLQN
jgi:hypothetical protein